MTIEQIDVTSSDEVDVESLPASQDITGNCCCCCCCCACINCELHSAV